ncbi:hypothetical protein PALU110988_27200 [Paenibacillus lupini]|nr:hypothetical protein [Paenibacillus lupini]
MILEKAFIWGFPPYNLIQGIPKQQQSEEHSNA